MKRPKARKFFTVYIILILLAMSCSDHGDLEHSDAFALAQNDYMLDCDPIGKGADSLACQLAYYTNREREGHPEESSLAMPLNWQNELATAAGQYSRRMCDENFFDHNDPRGSGIEVRLYKAGIVYVKAGENLARGTYLLPSEAMAMFMNEPPCRVNHRGNILDPDFTHIGVGAVICGTKIIYTQLFATFHPDDIREDKNEFCSPSF